MRKCRNLVDEKGEQRDEQVQKTGVEKVQKIGWWEGRTNGWESAENWGWESAENWWEGAEIWLIRRRFGDLVVEEEEEEVRDLNMKFGDFFCL